MSFANWIESTLLGPLWSFIQVLFKQEVSNVMAALVPLATAAVAQVAADPTVLTDTAKRDAAFATIAKQAAAAGIAASVNAINTAIELAVLNAKGTALATPAP